MIVDISSFWEQMTLLKDGSGEYLNHNNDQGSNEMEWLEGAIKGM